MTVIDLSIDCGKMLKMQASRVEHGDMEPRTPNLLLVFLEYRLAPGSRSFSKVPCVSGMSRHIKGFHAGPKSSEAETNSTASC